MDLRLQVAWGWDRRIKSDRGLGGPLIPSEKSVFHAFVAPAGRREVSRALCGATMPVDTMTDLTAADLAGDSHRFGGICTACAEKTAIRRVLEVLGARLV
jgi:hypothetical protein